MKFCKCFNIGPYQVLVMIIEDEIRIISNATGEIMEVREDCPSRAWARQSFDEFDEKIVNEFICHQLSHENKLH